MRREGRGGEKRGGWCRGEEDTLTDSPTLSHTVYRKTSEEQQQFQARRAEEIFVNMKEVKQLARKKSMEVSQRVEERWKESEQKAKAFELTRRASFNKARQLSRKVGKV